MIFEGAGINTKICLASVQDQKLTNKAVLLVARNSSTGKQDDMLKLLQKHLPKYHSPKSVILVPKILMTKSGKVDRIRNTVKYL